MHRHLGTGGLLLAAGILLTGCQKSGSAQTTPAPGPTQTIEAVTEAPTPEPNLTYLEKIEKAIREEDTKFLREELRFWDSSDEKSGRYSITILSDFVSYMNAKPERLDAFMRQVEDEFYNEDEERIVLPAVYVYVTTVSDNTEFVFPFFGERTIDNAERKAQKLGPLLPTNYEITASCESWEHSQTAVVPISLSELSDESGSRHTYYLKFYSSEYSLYPDGEGAGSRESESEKEDSWDPDDSEWDDSAKMTEKPETEDESETGEDADE